MFMKIIQSIALILFPFVFLGPQSLGAEPKKNSSESLVAFKHIVTLITTYVENGKEETLNELKKHICEAEDPDTGGKLVADFRKAVGTGKFKNLEVLDRHWEDEGVALCLAVEVDPLSGFPKINRAILVKDVESAKWLMIAGDPSDLRKYEAIEKMHATIDGFLEQYEEAKGEIKRPFFERREKKREAERLHE